jgi:hypothetical protein
MRAQEELPGWITHVLDVGEGGVTPRTREGWKRGAINLQKSVATGLGAVEASVGVRPAQGEAKLIVDLKGVGVRYGNRTVSAYFLRLFVSFLCICFFPRDFFVFFSFRGNSLILSSFSFFHFLESLVPFLELSPFFFLSASLLKHRHAGDRSSKIFHGKSVKAIDGICRGRMVSATFFSSS